MGIEDIPEMIITNRGFDNYTDTNILDSSREPQGWRFIVMEGPNNRFHVYIAKKSLHAAMFYFFKSQCRQVYQCDAPFNHVGGGFIIVDNESIQFYGESESIGKYVREIVEPIAERWQKQNFPNHTIEFE